jgi:hypothetical protein
VRVLHLKLANERQKGAGFNRVLSGKDLGNTGLGDPESSSEILLRVATHRFRETP